MRAATRAKVTGQRRRGHGPGTTNSRERRGAQVHRSDASAAAKSQQESSGARAATSRGSAARDQQTDRRESPAAVSLSSTRYARRSDVRSLVQVLGQPVAIGLDFETDPAGRHDEVADEETGLRGNSAQYSRYSETSGTRSGRKLSGNGIHPREP